MTWNNFTVQELQLAISVGHYIVLPAVWWMGRQVERKIVTKVTEVIDGRAKVIATMQDNIVKQEIDQQIKHLDKSMADHEEKDVKRFEELRGLLPRRRRLRTV